MHHLDVGALLHHFHRQVQHRPHARAGVGQLARLAAGQGDHLGHGLGGKTRARHQHHGRRRHQAHGNQVALGVVLHGCVDQLGHADRAVEAHQHGIAVGLGRDRLAHAQHAAGAGHVVHHHRLLQAFAQLLADQARGRVDVAAGAEGHDQGDGLERRPGGGRGQGRGHGKCTRGRQAGGAEKRASEHSRRG
ncbi:hypothetical protein D3C78_1216850 [compost metagenome]